jgi:hypothetical protein
VNSRIRTCFISAVAGTHLGALRGILAEKGVQVVVPEELSPSSDWSSELASIISRVDLVIGVLDAMHLAPVSSATTAGRKAGTHS